MSRALLLIDPQYDFITGSLPVPGAAEAMTNLGQHILSTSYALKIITCDAHPENHCSFRESGGQWPAHCIKGTPGARIWESIALAVNQTPGTVHILEKGCNSQKEEYSIWQSPVSCGHLEDLLRQPDIEVVDVCGLAGDICVLNSLADAVQRFGPHKFNVLKAFSPSLDKGMALDNFCSAGGICIR